jgi:SAM-dependent methyltransferase
MDDPHGAAPLPAWRTCLDIEEVPAGHYLGYVNATLLQAIAGSPSRVLELGCAIGAFGAALKARYPSAKVTGIEAGRGAADAAAARLDRVVCGRIEDVDLAALEDGPFDLVVAGDVLEHLVNPWRALERVRQVMTPDGQLVASIPNVRNLQVVMPLLQEGRWRYAERGLLDVTHLRFFTLEEMGRMLRETGFAMEGYQAMILPGLEEHYRNLRSQPAATLQVGRVTFSDLTPQEALELCAAQFVLRARPAS